MGWEAPELVGESPAFLQMIERAEEVAAVDDCVLLVGGEGNGVTTLARAIARNSARAAGPTVGLHLETIPIVRMERELNAAFASAMHGTLMIEGVFALVPALQRSLGDVLVEWSAEVRVIATTTAARERTAFRADVRARLERFVVPVPALEERLDDIPLLAVAFAGSGTRLGISDEAVRACRARHWFNVRALAHGIAHAKMRASDAGRQIIEARDLPP